MTCRTSWQLVLTITIGGLLRKVRVVTWPEIEDEVYEQLAGQERNDLRLLDLLFLGRVPTRPESPEIWVAIEISGQVDGYEVVHAQR